MLLLLFLSIGLAHSSDNDVMQETLKIMLDFDKLPEEVSPVSFTFPSKRAAHFMRELYDTFVEDDGSDDGNIVRSIEPSVGKLDGQEVLVFDISHLGKEEIQRAELHFYLRKRGFSRRRARSLSAKALCLNDYCTEGQYLHQLPLLEDGVVWDATKALVESHALGGKQLVFRINRKDVRMRSYSEMVRKSTPFLLIFSKADNTIDAEVVTKEVETAKRKRRDAPEGYYSYNSDFETSTKSADNRVPPVYPTRIFGKKRIRAHRRRQKPDDIWAGFGEEETTPMPQSSTMSNDVRVVLLGEKEKKSCSRESLMVNLNSLGWNEYVIAPLAFDYGRCSGSCPNPLPKSSSNHANLQSLLEPREAPCCAPTALRSLTVLFRDQNGRVTLKNFPQMIVDRCECL